MESNKERIKQVYQALPGLNCGLCGFGGCGPFARAVVEGSASPFGCRQNPGLGYRISEIIGVKVPTYGYSLQPALATSSGVAPSVGTLREEVRGLSRRVDGILARIEHLKAKGMQP